MSGKSPVKERRQSMHSISTCENGFIAVGSSGTILGSLNRLEWSQRVSGVRVELRGISFGQGRFVAVGSHQTILVSLDGHHGFEPCPAPRLEV
jgi:hypothetical protein